MKRRRTIDPVLAKVLDDVLNNKVRAIPEVADLPRLWKEAPSEASGLKHPWKITRETLLALYITLAPIQPSYREGLRRLSLSLTMNGEPIPPRLSWWNYCLAVLGDPPPKRGRPRELDEHIKISTMFRLLGSRGYTREDAMSSIAETMDSSPETIRSVVRKYRIPLR